MMPQCAYSRWLFAMLLPSRHAEDLFAGWWRLITALGAVPRVLVGRGGRDRALARRTGQVDHRTNSIGRQGNRRPARSGVESALGDLKLKHGARRNNAASPSRMAHQPWSRQGTDRKPWIVT
jgi:hypothetical protein